MLILDLDKCKDLKSCRAVYRAGDSYCAMGKLLYGLDMQIPYMSDGYHIASDKVNDFIVEVGKNINNMRWMQEVTDINDAPGDLRENSEKAFRLAVNYVLQSGLVQLKACSTSNSLSMKV